MTKFSISALHRHIQNAKVRTWQRAVLAQPGSNGTNVIAYMQKTKFRAFVDSELAVERLEKKTKKSVLVAIGQLQLPGSESLYLSTLTLLRNAIKAGDLDDRDHVVPIETAKEKAIELMELYPNHKLDGVDLSGNFGVFATLAEHHIRDVHLVDLWSTIMHQRVDGMLS